LLFVTKNGVASVREIKYKIEKILNNRKFPVDILVYKEEDFNTD